VKSIARLKNYRVSPQKARLIMSLVQGYDVDVAISHLEHSTKKFSHQLKKLILSALANAQNNNGLSKNNLFVEDVKIGEGVTYKRWMPRAYGRATPVMKRTSNVVVILKERQEGKDRLTEEQIKKSRKEAQKVKQAEKTGGAKSKKASQENKEGVAKDIKGKQQSSASGKAKIFRRKSV